MKLRYFQNLMVNNMVARTDFTSIDLSSLSDIIRGKMNMKNQKLINYYYCTSEPSDENPFFIIQKIYELISDGKNCPLIIIE